MEDTVAVTEKVKEFLQQKKSRFNNKTKTKVAFKNNKAQRVEIKDVISDDIDPDTDQNQQEEELNDTIFIRNVSRFETTAESLKEYIEKNFGETVYCLICKDRETGESKGTAFVKFKSAETAQQCLDEFEDRDLQTKFFLDGRNLFVLPALTREKAAEVHRAVAAANDPPKEKKIKTRPRHNRAKPISQNNGENPESSEAPLSHQKKYSFKKNTPFKRNEGAKKKFQKHQHKFQLKNQHKSHGKQAQSGLGDRIRTKAKNKNKSLGSKRGKSSVKNANQKHRGRH